MEDKKVVLTDEELGPEAVKELSNGKGDDE